MRLSLSLPVLVVVLAMTLEAGGTQEKKKKRKRKSVCKGPAPAQAAPDISSTLEGLPDKLKEFGNTLEDKARAAIDHIKQKEILSKTRISL